MCYNIQIILMMTIKSEEVNILINFLAKSQNRQVSL